MSRRTYTACAGLFVLLLGTMAPAGWSAELGDAAAPLHIEQWVKGEPAEVGADPDAIYVVEFWATWCGPCRTSIPHLTELQSKYADDGVVFIGVSDEPAETVKPFVDEMGDKMDYRVAIDTTGRTHEGYMGAYNQGGIPTAFVVDREGRVVWLGHPMGGLDETLQAMVDGTYDVDAAKRAMEAEQDLERYFNLALSGESDEAHTVGERIVANASGNAELMNALSWNILTLEGIAERDLDLAMRAAQAAYDACDGQNAAIVDTYARAFYETGALAKAIQYQEQAIALAENEELRAHLTEILELYKNSE